MQFTNQSIFLAYQVYHNLQSHPFIHTFMFFVQLISCIFSFDFTLSFATLKLKRGNLRILHLDCGKRTI